ncbi:MAG: nitroreductase/quinone reductase family protein [Acidimicrobiales bacterium]|nr:nitroreductase/quinone reductase family protein [Acidimicrobiales bacterium]
MRTPDKVLDVGAWMLENGHRAVLKLTGGRYPRRLLGMQPVELHVVGRKSGERRSTLLTAPIIDDERIVLVASKGGSQDHPQWYKNLAANPEVEITVEGKTRKARARTATPGEKAELWPEIVRQYRGYEGYQRNTDRDIPVIICESR